MTGIRRLTTSIALATVAVGVLSLGGVTTAGAAAPAVTVSTTPAAGTAGTHPAACAHAGQAGARVQAIKSRFAAKIAQLNGLESKIRTSDTHRRARALRLRLLQKRITHENKLEAHVLNPRFLAREARLSKVDGARCHAPLRSTKTPAAVSPTTVSPATVPSSTH